MQEKSKLALWPERLRERAASGLSIRAWCALNGVTEASYRYWRKRLAAPAPAASFIALPFAGGPGEPALELQTPHGYVIRLASAAQVGWLGAVLAALR